MRIVFCEDFLKESVWTFSADPTSPYFVSSSQDLLLKQKDIGQQVIDEISKACVVEIDETGSIGSEQNLTKFVEVLGHLQRRSPSGSKLQKSAVDLMHWYKV